MSDIHSTDLAFDRRRVIVTAYRVLFLIIRLPVDILCYGDGQRAKDAPDEAQKQVCDDAVDDESDHCGILIYSPGMVTGFPALRSASRF